MTKAKEKDQEEIKKLLGHRMEISSPQPVPGQVISMEKEELDPELVEIVEAPDAPQVFGFTTYRKKAVELEGGEKELSPYVYFVANE